MSTSQPGTLAREQPPVRVVVYDNAADGANADHFADHERGPHLVRFPASDVAAIACGAGAFAVTVRSVAELDAVEAWPAERRGPLLMDAMISGGAVEYWAAQDFLGR